MARARGGGSSGYAIALVIFAAGFVLSLLLAIVFFVQVGGANEERITAEDALIKFANRNEQNAPEVVAILGDPSKGTVVGQLSEETRSLKNMINADPTTTVEALESQANAAGVSGTLLGEVKRLSAELQSATQRAANAEAAREKALAAQQDAEARVKAIKEAFAKAEAELAQRADGTAADASTYLAKINEMDQKFQTEMANIRTELQKTIDEQQSQIVIKDRKIRELEVALNDPDAEGVEPTEVTLPDGRIMSIGDNGRTVYIDRGRADNLILGMTFEVYDSGDLVKLDEFGDARGKATIEVTGLDERNAVARVVRQERGTGVKTGDQIINIAYDPNATLKFFVYGDFDIENTGEPSRADRKRVEGMIDRWGGEISEELTPNVDFLVLGSEPPSPTPLPPGETNPQKIQEFVQATKDFETYQNLKGDARLMSVPILNQNRFLTLIGFYER